jgi:O-Antigen ligase
MVSYTELRKISSYALILFILFTLSGASELSNDKTVLIVGWLFFTGVYLYFENYIKPLFFYMTALFAGIVVVYYVLNGAVNGVTYLGFFIKIYLAYCCRDLCKDDFFDYFVRIIYVLTGISLVFFTLQLINFDFFYNLNNFFGVEKDLTAKASSIIFTMVPIHEFRNCGFMWEPGSFVTVLIMTYYINIFKQGASLFSKENIVFLIAIITTQSTMGILSLLIPFGLLLGDVVVQNRTYKQLSIVIVPTVLITMLVVFTQVDFLYKKIVSEVTTLDEEMDIVAKGEKEDYIVAVSRSASVILDMPAIKKHPLLGLGIDMRTTGFSKLGYSEKLQTACGSTILLLRFGLIGFVIYTVLLYKNAFFERTIHKVGWVLLINYALFTQEISASSFFHLFIF